MDNQQPSSDEIDLLRFVSKVYRFILQHWLLLAICVAGSTAVSWYWYSKAPDVYRSQMAVRSEFITESYARQIIVGFQRQIEAGRVSRLGLSSGEAGSIRTISADSPLGERAGSVREDEKLIFLIVADVYDTAILGKLQAGIVNAFASTDYVKLRLAERRKNYQSVIDRIEKEINMLDGGDNGSLYQRQMPRLNRTDEKYNAAIFSPSTMRVYMYKDKAEFEEKLALLKGLEVVEGFTPSSEKVSPKLSVFVASGFSSGIILAVIILVWRSLHLVSKKYPD